MSPLRLPDGSLVDATGIRLDYERVAADQLVSGDPMIGVLPLGTVGGADIGIWEMTEGVMNDIEVDEVFVVLSGRADVVIHSGGPAGAPLELHLEVGTVGRLASGMTSTWTVHEPLRKLYVLGVPPSGTFLPLHAVDHEPA